jgi:L-ascorbate metabolism protein UlaG (beta-lactamase superfamily)
MTRYLSAVVATMVLAGLAGAADTKTIILRWHGQSFFDLESSQGTRVAFDPHAIEEFGRTPVKADLVLVSHFHTDHSAVGVIENREKAKVLYGLKMTGKNVDWNPIDEKFKDVRVYTVGVYHDEMQGLQRGKNAVFVVELDGMRFVHLGDLGHLLTDEQVKKIGPVDVLMIPVGGVYSINGEDAKKVVEQLKPRKYIVPMHYGITGVYEDLLPIDSFLEDQKKENIPRRLQLRNELKVESDFKPAEPIIAVLNYK